MSDDKKEYAVVLGDPGKVDSLRKFALAVSMMLVRLAGRIIALEYKTTTTSARTAGGSTQLTPTFVVAGTGKSVSVASAKFNLAGYSDESVGYELDVSGDIGGGIGGTVQGYTLNYGNGLTAGFLGNNETPTQPRIDVGFKSKRGGQMEMYASAVEGEAALARDGQLRYTIGPTGYIAFFRFVSGTSWKCIGGIDPNGRIVAGWNNTGFPGDADQATPPGGVAKAPPPYPVTVYNEGTNTHTPVGGITKGGVFTGVGIVLSDEATGVVINGKTYTRTPVLASDGVTVVYALACAT